MGDIFEEIDEEVRRDRLHEVWKDYGGYIIAGVVAIVLGVSAAVGWREYSKQRHEADSDRFVKATALAASGKPAEAAAAFQTLSDEAADGYALFARFRAADALKDSGDIDGAVQIFEGIATDSAVDDLYRDLATLLAIMHMIDGSDPEAMRARLTPLLADNAVWRHSARELSGALALKMGDQELAKTEFQKLADDLLAPPGARARATEILQILGG